MIGTREEPGTLTEGCFPCSSRLGVCLLLQDLLQRCSRGGRRRVEDMDYERRRAEACVDGTSGEPGTFTQGAPVFPGSSNTPWNWNRPNV